jgi:hypothetical protein
MLFITGNDAGDQLQITTSANSLEQKEYTIKNCFYKIKGLLKTILHHEPDGSGVFKVTNAFPVLVLIQSLLISLGMLQAVRLSTYFDKLYKINKMELAC